MGEVYSAPPRPRLAFDLLARFPGQAARLLQFSDYFHDGYPLIAIEILGHLAVIARPFDTVVVVFHVSAPFHCRSIASS